MIITKRIPIELITEESYVHNIGYSYLNIYRRRPKSGKLGLNTKNKEKNICNL